MSNIGHEIDRHLVPFVGSDHDFVGVPEVTFSVTNFHKISKLEIILGIDFKNFVTEILKKTKIKEADLNYQFQLKQSFLTVGS